MRPLDDIQRDADAATPGPLTVRCPDGWPAHCGPALALIVDDGDHQVADCYDNTRLGEAQCAANALFFALARTDVPDLLALARRLISAAREQWEQCGWCQVCGQHRHAKDCPIVVPSDFEDED